MKIRHWIDQLNTKVGQVISWLSGLLVNLVGGILFLLPWSAVMIISSFQYGLDSLAIGERSPDPGGLPARYLIKFAITGGFMLLFLQGISSVLASISTLKNSRSPWK